MHSFKTNIELRKECNYQDSYVLSTHLVTKGLFVRNVTITVPVRSFNVSMVTGTLTDKMCLVPILFIKVPVPTDTMLNFDSDFDGHGDADDTCKQTLRRIDFKQQKCILPYLGSVTVLEFSCSKDEVDVINHFTVQHH